MSVCCFGSLPLSSVWSAAWFSSPCVLYCEADWVSMQLRHSPNAVSYSGLWGERRMPRAEMWWLVSVWERARGKKKHRNLPTACFCSARARSCVRTCDRQRTLQYVWEEEIFPDVFFLEPLPVFHNPLSSQPHGSPSHPTSSSQSRRRTSERSQCFSSPSRAQPASNTFPNVTINPTLRRTRFPTFSPSSVCWCFPCDLADVSCARVRASAVMCLLRAWQFS